MHMKVLVAEALASFAFCLVASGAVLANATLGPAGFGYLGVALATGFILCVVVTITLPISGGHVNPAITLALLAVGRMRAGVAMRYILAQTLGAALAGLFLGQVFYGVKAPGNVDVVRATSNGAPRVDVIALGDAGRPDELSTDRAGFGAMRARAQLRAFWIEMLITGLLVFAFCGTTLDPRRINVAGMGVGLMAAANVLLAGPLTGAGMNPARALGVGWVAGGEVWAEQWVFWLGPVIGAVLAAFAYEYLVMERSAGRAAR